MARMDGGMNWVEIDAGALRWNLDQFRNRLGSAKLGAVVKSNAYGHGMETIAGLAESHGADSFCVHSLDEALRLLHQPPPETACKRRAGLARQVLETEAEAIRNLMDHLDGDFDRAVEAGQRSVELDPSNLIKRINYAIYATYAGDFETAIECGATLVRVGTAIFGERKRN